MCQEELTPKMLIGSAVNQGICQMTCLRKMGDIYRMQKGQSIFSNFIRDWKNCCRRACHCKHRDEGWNRSPTLGCAVETVPGDFGGNCVTCCCNALISKIGHSKGLKLFEQALCSPFPITIQQEIERELAVHPGINSCLLTWYEFHKFPLRPNPNLRIPHPQHSH